MNTATILESAFLGILQGVTEFIPISSSGHLYLLPQLFGWEPPSTIFILAVHLGTLIALIIYFRKLLWSYFKSILVVTGLAKSDSPKQSQANIRTIFLIVLATIPAAVIGLLMEDIIADFYDSDATQRTATQLTLAAMVILGVVFIKSERIFTGKKHDLTKLSTKGALGIGVSQVLAFIRGTSRSGVTLISGQLFGLSRVSAAEFSFLMSIPVLIAASAVGIYDLSQLPVRELQPQLNAAIVGLVGALVSGFLAIRFMLNYLKKHNLAAFGWYRIVFALIIFLLLFT